VADAKRRHKITAGGVDFEDDCRGAALSRFLDSSLKREGSDVIYCAANGEHRDSRRLALGGYCLRSMGSRAKGDERK